jgi:biotin carboxyl carrier protein
VNYVVELEGGERWEVSIDSDQPARVQVEGEARNVDIESRADGTMVASVDGRRQVVRICYEDGGLVVETPDGRRRKVRVETPAANAWRRHVEDQGKTVKADGPSELCAPIAGSIVELLVSEGARVERGQPVIKLEAMKMLNSIASPGAGLIHFEVKPGQTVRTGNLIARITTGSHE